jgi:hypothetical protein
MAVPKKIYLNLRKVRSLRRGIRSSPIAIALLSLQRQVNHLKLLRIPNLEMARGSDVRSQNFCIRVPRRSIPELSETQQPHAARPSDAAARSTTGQVRRPLSSTPSADQTSARGRPSKDKNPPRLVALFVDRTTGIFLRAWKIKIFPDLWADPGSTKFRAQLLR